MHAEQCCYSTSEVLLVCVCVCVCVCVDAVGLVYEWCLVHLKYAVLQCIPDCFQHSPHVQYLCCSFEGLRPEKKTLKP
jgi:hypothetical protein